MGVRVQENCSRTIFYEGVDLFAKGSALPLSTMISHVQAPQMDGVAPYAKVFDGIVVGTGLDDDRSTVFASTEVRRTGCV